MKKIMKNPTVILSVLAVLFISVATFAFTSPDERREVNTIYWFEYDGVSIGEYMGNTPNAVCSEVSGQDCALGFSEDDVSISGSEVELEPGVTPGQAIDDAHKL